MSEQLAPVSDADSADPRGGASPEEVAAILVALAQIARQGRLVGYARWRATRLAALTSRPAW